VHCYKSVYIPGPDSTVISAFAGTIGVGAECLREGDCVPGAFCDKSATCPGICAPQQPLGAACSESVGCVQELTCGASGTCSPPGSVGQSCADFDDCQLLLTCDLDAGGVCAAYPDLPAGAPCSDDQECFFGLYCKLDDPQPTCTVRAENGAPCSNPYPACALGSYCDLPLGADSGVCVPLLQPGEPCQVGSCTLLCDSDTLTCVEKRPLGEPCPSDLWCSSGSCVDGVCASAAVCPP
jgi:hypothetical protein